MARRCIAIMLLLLTFTLAEAQKVGLVLSGGGAKGLYHVGVIKALEENDIPIDYIAGTSMGSIIAGLYAIGYTPEQMQKLLETDQIVNWVTGKIDSRHTQLLRLQDEIPSMLRLKFNITKSDWQELSETIREQRKNRSDSSIKKAWQLPTDLISSQQIDMALSMIFAPASEACGGDFSKLMIPFFCVASDMNARQPVVFHHGSLDKAIRSSMSIPLVFKPMREGDMLLYDGGLFDNFPWQRMQDDFKPDYIIGSQCTDNDVVDETSNLLDQALMLISQKTDYNLSGDNNINIARKVNAGMLDFIKAKEIIQTGYEDALAKMSDIKEVVNIRRTRKETDAIRQAFLRQVPKLDIYDIDIEGLTKNHKEYAEKRLYQTLGSRYKETTISYNALWDYTNDIIADGDFTMGYPILKYDSLAGKFKATIPFKTKPQLKLLFGGNLSSTAYNQLRLGLSIRKVGSVGLIGNADFFLGPIYNAGRVGGQMFLSSRKPIAFDLYYLFSVRNTLRGNFGNVTKIDNSTYMKLKEHYISLSMDAGLSRKSMLQLTMNVGQDYYKYNDEDDVTPSYFKFLASRLRVMHNTLDNELWPTRGLKFEGSAIVVGGILRSDVDLLNNIPIMRNTTNRWFGFKASFSHYANIPSCRWFSFGYALEGVYTNRHSFEEFATSLLSLPAYEPNQNSKFVHMPHLHAAQYVGVSLMPTFSPFNNFYIRAGYYGMFRDKGHGNDQFHHIVDFSVIYKTIAGPLTFNMTKYGFDNKNNLYLSVNFGYLLFTPKGMFY